MSESSGGESAGAGSAGGQVAVSSPPPLYLVTLGTPAMTRGGRPLEGAASQRKPLALLALLASHGAAGVSRDRVLALLWPEMDDPRARGALKQTVYALRRDTGEPRIVTGTQALALDQAAIVADVGRFRRAVELGDLEEAVRLYRGPFLDGLFLPDAGPFEEWLETERSALARIHRTSLRTLAVRSAGTPAAAEWWRRLLEADPLDSAAAVGLMEAMAGTSQVPAALRVAREHAALVRRELHTDPDPAVTALEEKLRRTVPPTPVAVAAPREVPEAPAPTEGAGPTGALRRTRAVRLIAAIAAAALAGLLLRPRSPPASPPSLHSPVSVLVLPFDYQGTPGHEDLRNGVRELVQRGLEGMDGIRVVDPRAAVATLGTIPSADSAGVRAAAARMGADLIVRGTIVMASDRLRILASAHPTGHDRPGTRAAAAQVNGDPAAIFVLADRLSAQLLAQLRPATERRLLGPAAATSSLTAFKAFAEGEALFLGGRYPEAVSAYQRAVAEDSGFALAYYRLSLASDWASMTDLSPAAAEQAVRHQERLPARERALLKAYFAWRRGQADEAEEQYRAILAAYPTDVEAWFQLGEVLFHGNPFRGRSISEARAPFAQVLRFEPSNERAVSHLVRVVANERRRGELDSLLQRVPEPANEAWLDVFRYRASPDPGSLERAVERVASEPDVVVYTAVERAAVYLRDFAAAEALARTLLEPSRPVQVRVRGRLTLAELALARGRWEAAQRELEAAAALAPGVALAHRALLTASPFLPLDTAATSGLRARLARPFTLPASPESVYLSWQEFSPALLGAYLRGILAARGGDSLGWSGELERLERLSGSRRDEAQAANLAHSIRAMAAWQAGNAVDGLTELQRAEAPTRIETIRTPFGAQSFERYLRAELLEALGDEASALGWYRSMGESTTFDLAYLGPSLLRMGRIHERLGNAEAAADAYRELLELWRECDAALRPARDEAARRLEALNGAS